MPSIGSENFMTMTGDTLPELAETVVEITRKNVDGHAFRTQGKQSSGQSVQTTTDAATAAAARTLKTNYEAMRGTIVTIINSKGETYQNVIVLDVRASIRLVKRIVGGITVNGTANDPYLVVAQWTLQQTQTP